jgi:diguanylate cyclase (GGDEF)-like protein
MHVTDLGMVADPSRWTTWPRSLSTVGSVHALPPEYWALTVLAIIADARPFPTRGPLRLFGGVFVSITFTFSILLVWGVVPAIVAQTLALLGGAIRLRWGLERTLVLFTAFALAFIAAGAVLAACIPRLFGIGSVITGADSLYILAAAATWFVVYYAVFAIWLASRRYPGSMRQIFARQQGYGLLWTGALLLIAPLIVGAPNVWSLWLAILPVIVVNQVAWLYTRLDHQLQHDQLTGLLSRRALVREIGDLVTARRRGQPADVDERFALLLLDLDQFKQVNDGLGHATGDRLLAVVAQRLSSAVPATDSVARLGGDEFAVIAKGRGGAGAQALAEDIAHVLNAPAVLDDQPLYVSASIGVAVFPDDGDDYPTLMRHADAAMYEAKHHSDPIARYAADFDQNSATRLSLLADLRLALEDPAHLSEITLHYQPQVRISTGEMVGVEALLRWRHPQRGLVNVPEVIQIAEHSPIMRDLTRRVVSDVVDQLARWNAAGFAQQASLNVSGRDLDTMELPNYLAETLRRAGVAPSQVKVEVTETALLGDPEPSQAAIQELSRLGIALALDDFGTGYSSLAHLRRLPVSEIKIDKSFVSRMTANPEDRAIVESIILLGRTLRLEVVAEGVENEQTAYLLLESGCDTAQGWLYAPAMPADELPVWYAAHPPDARAARSVKAPRGSDEWTQ